jgi:S-(hydroxymethyl)glutathione dehydrogenase/alcohol dehydrogenase
MTRWRLITGRTVMGASIRRGQGREQVARLVDRYLAGDIDADAFVSHRITLDDINTEFDPRQEAPPWH